MPNHGVDVYQHHQAWFSVAHCYNCSPVYYSMTATINRNYTILNVEFDADQLKDIVNHGMSAGVSGFIYTRDCIDKFNEHDDEIEEYLSDWYHDNMGEDNYIGAIASSGTFSVGSVDELMTKMVWSYVELKAFEILSENGYEF